MAVCSKKRPRETASKLKTEDRCVRPKIEKSLQSKRVDACVPSSSSSKAKTCKDKKSEVEKVDESWMENLALPYDLSGFNIYLGDLLIEGKKKMQAPGKDNGVTCSLVGSSGAGKTTLLRKVFIDDIYGPRADKDYITTIFTESPNSDALEDLPGDVKLDPNGIDQDLINWSYKMNMKFQKQFNFIFLLDDCIHIRYQKQIERMFLIMRNTNITSAVSLQYANLIPRSIRTSVYYIFLMHHNTPEGAQIAVEAYLTGYLPGKNIAAKSKVYQVWAREHRFYFVDNLNDKCYAVTADFMCKELPQILNDDDNNQACEPSHVSSTYNSPSTDDSNTNNESKKRKRQSLTKSTSDSKKKCSNSPSLKKQKITPKK